MTLSDVRSYDYCKLNKHCTPKKHTVCLKNNVCDPQPGCQEILVTEDFKVEIVSLHNLYRNKVATGQEKQAGDTQASDMMKLKWDKDLEYTARCNANWCMFTNDCGATKKFPMVGQNIYKVMGPFSVTKAMENFYNEVQMIKKPWLNKLPVNTRGTNHFTQLINAKTTRVGCATSFNVKEKFTYLVCNYGPKGNVVGLPVFLKGPMTTKCPKGYSADLKFAGLCTNASTSRREDDDFYDDDDEEDIGLDDIFKTGAATTNLVEKTYVIASLFVFIL